MNEIYFKTKKYENMAVLIFKLLFLTVGFLQASSLTFGKPIISFVQWPTVALGCLILLYRFVFFKNYISTRGIVLLIIFAAGYAASSIYTIRYGYYENLRTLIFMVMQFGILYAFDAKADPEWEKKQFTACGFLHIIGTAVLSFISFCFMAANYTKTFIPEAGTEGPVYYHGFVHGRLFGAYWDPNIAATMAALSVLLSLYFIIKYKKLPLRVLLCFNTVLQIMYITFSDSRTGKITLFAGLFIFALLILAERRMLKNIVFQVTAVTLITVTTAFIIPKATKICYNKAMIIASQNGENKTHTNVPSDQVQPEPSDTDEPANILDRGYDTKEDISNRRFDIWKSAIEIFKTSPILGISRSNILPYVDDNLPNSYLVTNDHMRFDSMHNMFLEILASQGLVGIISFVLFAAWVVIGIIKNAKRLWQSENFDMYAITLSIAALACTATLVMAEIVYVISPISTLFWMSIGTLNHFSAKEKEI